MGAYGSCGVIHADSDFIVALPTAQFSAAEIKAHCGQTVSITNVGGGKVNEGIGKTLTAVVADTCPGCVGQGLDLSTGLWEALHGGNRDDGVFEIEWYFG